jgi:hypothetical protein
MEDDLKKILKKWKMTSKKQIQSNSSQFKPIQANPSELKQTQANSSKFKLI